MMKKILLSILFIFFVTVVSAEDKPLFDVTYSIGSVDVVVGKSKSTNITTGKKSRVVLTFNNGSEIRVDENSLVVIKEKDIVEIQLKKGNAWISSMGEFVLNGGFGRVKVEQGVLSIIKKKVQLYQGKALKINKTSVENIAVSKVPESDWAAWNKKRDQVSVSIEFKAPIKYKDFSMKTLLSFLENEYYISGVAYYDTGDGARNDTGNDIPGDMHLRITMTADDDVMKVKGAVINIIDKETDINIIRFEQKIVKGNENIVKTFAAAKLMSDTANGIQSIARSVSGESHVKGRDIAIEMKSENNGNIIKIKEILEKTPGIISMEMTDFYGKKTVFALKYRGILENLTEMLTDKKIKKSRINVWKISKNIVKLEFVKE